MVVVGARSRGNDSSRGSGSGAPPRSVDSPVVVVDSVVIEHLQEKRHHSADTPRLRASASTRDTPKTHQDERTATNTPLPTLVHPQTFPTPQRASQSINVDTPQRHSSQHTNTKAKTPTQEDTINAHLEGLGDIPVRASRRAFPTITTKQKR